MFSAAGAGLERKVDIILSKMPVRRPRPNQSSKPTIFCVLAAFSAGARPTVPIALLLVGSVGGSWTNTLLPSGVTGQWYLDLWQDSSFRKAFASSLVVALAACAINTVLALLTVRASRSLMQKG